MNTHFLLTAFLGSAILTVVLMWIARWPETTAIWKLAKVTAALLTLWGGTLLVTLIAVGWFAK